MHDVHGGDEIIISGIADDPALISITRMTLTK
jgi:hypothetical protein